MNREVKNQLTKRRILDSALTVFAKTGYWGSSLNDIRAVDNISKGIIYHYFESKDDLYLSCVEECFTKLTAYIEDSVELGKYNIEGQLEEYFTARMNFFRNNPNYQRIFCEAIVNPPLHLQNKISQSKRGFDDLNTNILAFLLNGISLRPGITKADVIETFKNFQDVTNSNFHFSYLSEAEFEDHEKKVLMALNILLYGIVAERE